MSEESNLKDQIENLEDGYESLKYRHKKEKQELISEFVNNLKNHKKEISKTSWSGYIYSRKEEIKMVEELIKKWEEKLK